MNDAYWKIMGRVLICKNCKKTGVKFFEMDIQFYLERLPVLNLF